jgi:hypothetical protein
MPVLSLSQAARDRDAIMEMKIAMSASVMDLLIMAGFLS